jgi:hypothetical protein
MSCGFRSLRIGNLWQIPLFLVLTRITSLVRGLLTQVVEQQGRITPGLRVAAED